MKKRHLIIALFLFASVFLEGYNFVSPMVQQRQSYIKNPQVYDLQQKNIIINSERVFNDSLQFTKNNDYQIDYQKGQIFFKKAVGKITIEFLIYPSKLLNKFSYYLVLDYVDSLDFKVELVDFWGKGGEGGLNLAQTVVDQIEHKKCKRIDFLAKKCLTKIFFF